MNPAQITDALNAFGDPLAPGEIIAAQRKRIVELRAATGRLHPALIVKALQDLQARLSEDDRMSDDWFTPVERKEILIATFREADHD